MRHFIKNQQVTDSSTLPNAESVSEKLRRDKFPRVRTGVLLAGSALIGCFAVAVWNRKALVSLVRGRIAQREDAPPEHAGNDDAIY